MQAGKLDSAVPPPFWSIYTANKREKYAGRKPRQCSHTSNFFPSILTCVRVCRILAPYTGSLSSCEIETQLFLCLHASSIGQLHFGECYFGEQYVEGVIWGALQVRPECWCACALQPTLTHGARKTGINRHLFVPYARVAARPKLHISFSINMGSDTHTPHIPFELSLSIYRSMLPECILSGSTI